jgi:hypothetical protein
MMHLSLVCEKAHEFEGWFRSNEDFDAQSARSFVSCPHCGSTKVERALMAPAVSTGRKHEQMTLAAGAEQRKLMAEMKQMAQKLRENSENVGPRFAEEARRIHFGEAEARSIYGEASVDEVRSLAEDGVGFMPLPAFPDEQN